MLVDEVGGTEDEHLAHQVRVLLVSAHEPDDLPAGRVLDHPGEALAHDLLKLHALLDDRRAAPALEQGLLIVLIVIAVLLLTGGFGYRRRGRSL